MSNEGLFSKRVLTLLGKMTIEEKVGQMNQYSGFWDATGPEPRNQTAKDKHADLRNGKVGSMLNVHGAAKIRALQEIVVNESRLGIPMIFGLDVIHGYKTISPIPLAESASWDMEAIERSAKMAAKEAAASGVNWTFAPMVDTSRDPRWGRVMEGAGEDPFLGSAIAKARVMGFQGDDLSSHETVLACAKHFAAYGFVEAGREYNRADISTSTLYNIVLPPFKACVDAGVGTFMNSFNTLNGIPATANKELQRQLLKEDWQFKGFVVSDWASGRELIYHGFAKDSKEAARLAATAGSDMDMESYIYHDHIKELVEEGLVHEDIVNDAVARILQAKENLGLLDDPYKYCDVKREEGLIEDKDIRQANLEIAKKSLILLKNEDSILPITKRGSKIAIIGELAADKNSPLGNWRISAESNTAVSVLEGFDHLNIDYSYERGPKIFSGPMAFHLGVEVNESDRSGMQEAIDLAEQSETVILVLGEHGLQSGEGRSRTNLDLPGLQQELLEEVYKVNKNVVLVIMSGRPLTLTWADDHIRGIIQAWHLGTESGHAIAETLIGKNNPSGKAPMTFPRSVGQIPIFYNHYSNGRPNPQRVVFWSHYRDESNEPLYPFGHGLSYSTFEYSNLEVGDFSVDNNNMVVEVTLKNSSDITGREVVQLYIRDINSRIVRPLKELKAFKSVELEARESTIISFKLSQEDLGYYDNKGEFLVESGDFEFFIGGSSKHVLSERININFKEKNNH
jgi:beta-glucosidase